MFCPAIGGGGGVNRPFVDLRPTKRGKNQNGLGEKEGSSKFLAANVFFGAKDFDACEEGVPLVGLQRGLGAMGASRCRWRGQMRARIVGLLSGALSLSLSLSLEVDVLLVNPKDAVWVANGGPLLVFSYFEEGMPPLSILADNASARL